MAPACQVKGHRAGATITSYKDLPKDEAALTSYVFSSGPAAVAVDATSWQTVPRRAHDELHFSPAGTTVSLLSALMTEPHQLTGF